MAPTRSTQRLYGATPTGVAEARSWIGSRVTDSFGSGVGRLEDVWIDPEKGEPSWLLIREGRFGGGHHRLVPFEGATSGGDQVWLPFDRDTIRSSPEIGANEILTTALGERLRAHYASHRPA